MKKQAEDWERRAMLAVQEGRDDLAKQALGRYNEQLQGAQQLHETWVKHKAETDALKLSLRQLNDKIEEAKRKKNILVARAKRAEAQQRIQETMSGMSDKSAFESFERMAEKIEATRAQGAIAAAELNEEVSGDHAGPAVRGARVQGQLRPAAARAQEPDGPARAGQAPRPASSTRAARDVHDAELRGGGRRRVDPSIGSAPERRRRLTCDGCSSPRRWQTGYRAPHPAPAAQPSATDHDRPAFLILADGDFAR